MLAHEFDESSPRQRLWNRDQIIREIWMTLLHALMEGLDEFCPKSLSPHEGISRGPGTPCWGGWSQLAIDVGGDHWGFDAVNKSDELPHKT